MTSLIMFLSIFLVTANPGSDATKEININWHSYEAESRLELTTADDPNFIKSTIYVPREELWSLNCGDSLSAIPRYVCSVELKDLQKGTKYLYRILGKNSADCKHTSACRNDCNTDTYTRSFTTASGADNWKFIALADFQYGFNTVTHPLVESLKALASDAKFAFCSGDITDYGSNEAEWRHMMDHQVWDDLVFAATPGDHSYWMPGKNYPQMTDPFFFVKMFDFPKNGIEERKGSNYYFLYNNILFLGLDMCDSDTCQSDIFAKEVQWIKDVVKTNEGRCTWIVVFGHKSIFGSPETDSGVVKYIQPVFAPVFKEVGVDLVISGHDHKYSRTRQIDGTCYLDLGSSGDKFRSPEQAMYCDGLHEKVLDLKANRTCVGAIVTVSDKTLQVEVHDTAGNLVDAVELRNFANE